MTQTTPKAISMASQSNLLNNGGNLPAGPDAGAAAFTLAGGFAGLVVGLAVSTVAFDLSVLIYNLFVFAAGKEPIVDREWASFVQSKVIFQTFWRCSRVSVEQRTSKLDDKLASALEPVATAK